MTIDSGRLKHLEIIQQVITRMANNSFLIKGWSLTLLSLVLAIGLKEKIYTLLWVMLLPSIMLWCLDGYYLRQEKLFRKLWDKYKGDPQESASDFSMDTTEFKSKISYWSNGVFSNPLWIFHGTLISILVVISLFLYCTTK